MPLGGKYISRNDLGLVGYWCPVCAAESSMHATRIEITPWGTTALLSKKQLQSNQLVCERCQTQIGVAGEIFSRGFREFDDSASLLVESTLIYPEMVDDLRRLRTSTDQSSEDRINYFSEVLRLIDLGMGGAATNRLDGGLAVGIIGAAIAFPLTFAFWASERTSLPYRFAATTALVLSCWLSVWRYRKTHVGVRKRAREAAVRSLMPLKPTQEELGVARQVASAMARHSRIANWFNDQTIHACTGPEESERDGLPINT